LYDFCFTVVDDDVENKDDDANDDNAADDYNANADEADDNANDVDDDIDDADADKDGISGVSSSSWDSDAVICMALVDLGWNGASYTSPLSHQGEMVAGSVKVRDPQSPPP
jgi:hypothetical protein